MQAVARQTTRLHRHRRRRCSGFTYGNGLVHSRSLNARGLPLRVRDYSGSVSRLDYQYVYDKHGNPTQVTDYTTPAPWNENRSLAYDARDRMIQATAPNIYGVELYEYDALDNVRRMAGLPNGQGGYAVDFRFQYNASQRITGINDPGGAQQWGFTLNTLGETLTRAGQGQHWSYQWNAAGRMTRADRIYAGSTWETYVYDAHGHRSRSTRNTGTTRHQVYSRAGQLLYTEDTKDNKRIDYVYLGNKLIAQRSRPLTTSTATITWHHTDHLGSANLETNAAGTQTLRTIRMPYGSPYDGQYREGPGYAGHVTDTQTNLTYMQQRYYDPVALRFLSPDPVDVNPTYGSNFNRYWYANNNPYRYRDPDGRSPQDQWFGHGEADFRDWVHQEKQNLGRRHDFTKEEISELKKQWEAEGRPRGKGGRSSKGGMRRSMRGAVSVGALVRFNILTITAEAIFHSPSLNEGEDERLAERQRIYDQSISEPVGIVDVGEIVPAPSEQKPPDMPSQKKLPKEDDDL